MTDLQTGWIRCKAGDLFEIVGGGTPNASDTTNFAEPASCHAWLTPADLSGYSDKMISHGSRDLSSKGMSSCSARLLPAGSVLFTSRAPIGYVAIAENEISTNQGFKSFLPVDGVDPTYLYYYLRSIKGLAEDLGTGTTFKELSASASRKLPIVLAPSREQKRLAHELDVLLEKVAAISSRVEAIPMILKDLRQAVLDFAVSGDLSNAWRSTNPSLKLDISKLPEVSKTRRGVPHFVVIPEAIEPFTAPVGWVWASAAELLRKGLFKDIKDGNHGANHPKSSELGDEGIPFVTAANVMKSGRIDYEGSPKISGAPLDRIRVGISQPDDVILTHKGTVGRVAVNDRLCVLTPQTTYYRLNTEMVLPAYLAVFLRSSRFTRQTDQIKSQTTRDFVPITAQYELFHLLPPIQEQKVIASRVEGLLKLADHIDVSIDTARQRISALTQSLLEKAFRGRLVPQDPNDEPAGVLLERIRSHRDATPKQKRGLKATSN